jgi:DNA-binding XRE family transcriptional regulator
MTWTDEMIKKEAARDPEFMDFREEERKKIEIAIELLHLREENGLTQRELAERVGKPQSTIARIETGKIFPSFKLINDIAKALGKDVQLKFI